MSYGMYRDSFARLLDALLVERKDIRSIRIGRKVLYIKKEIDALIMVSAWLKRRVDNKKNSQTNTLRVLFIHLINHRRLAHDSQADELATFS